MNFLAHLYLSGNNIDLLYGNFIGDSVKGYNYNSYTTEVQKGILLHRQIDSFTDQHPLVRQSIHRLQKDYHKYAGIICDIFYDYFLAKKWNQYHQLPLQEYTQSVYTQLELYKIQMPTNAASFYEYMTTHNILYNYQFVAGITKVLEGMTYLIKSTIPLYTATDLLLEHEHHFEKEFTAFFEELKQFVEVFLSK